MRATNKVIGLAGARQVVHQQPGAGWKRLAAAVTHGKTAACPGIAQGNNAHRGRAGKGPGHLARHHADGQVGPGASGRCGQRAGCRGFIVPLYPLS